MYKKRLWKIQSMWESILNSSSSEARGVTLPGVNYCEALAYTPSSSIVHSDDYGEYFGIYSSQYIFSKGKTIFLCDNHNKILDPFTRYYHLEGSFSVVHVDAHRDDALFFDKKSSNPLGLNQIDGAIRDTRISDFFDYLSETKMIKNIYRYCDSVSIEQCALPDDNFILSLDIDIFGEEGAFVGDAEKIACIAKAWDKADMVCIAMSPGFIDQDFAKKLIDIFTS